LGLSIVSPPFILLLLEFLLVLFRFELIDLLEIFASPEPLKHGVSVHGFEASLFFIEVRFVAKAAKLFQLNLIHSLVDGNHRIR
jgi:hypothetical protein